METKQHVTKLSGGQNNKELENILRQMTTQP